jgi:hypothetical protein
MEPRSYFSSQGGRLVPFLVARSSWAEDELHGRLVAGLLARAVEGQLGDSYLCARLTVDLARPTPLEPTIVTSELVRRGRRVCLVDAAMSVESGTTARASALFLRRADDPPGRVWTSARWEGPLPDEIPALPQEARAMLPWDMRAVTGGDLVKADRKQVWLRDDRFLVEGEVPSPFVRVAMLADAANPLANSGSAGLRYVNADITLHLARDLEGEWVGFDVDTRVADSGVAVGACALHDVDGPIGMATVSALANRPWHKR